MARLTGALLCLAVLAFPGAASAQQSINESDNPITGELDRGDRPPAFAGSEYGDCYRFTARGQDYSYRISLESDDFDPVLVAGHGETCHWANQIRRDDDGGEGSDALIEGLQLSEAGYAYILVTGYGDEGFGDYTLRLDETTPIYGSVYTSLQSHARRRPNGAYYDCLTYEAEGGVTYEAVLTSNDFDAYLQAGAGDSCSDDIDISDDDDGGGTNARIRFTPDSDGPVFFRVSSLNAGHTGWYRIRVREDD